MEIVYRLVQDYQVEGNICLGVGMLGKEVSWPESAWFIDAHISQE